MNSFSRIITLLRKEKGITQKQAAADLGISQALLSHYEKGLRECGLDFLIKLCDYYNVSSDYILGRSPDRSGAVLTVDDLEGAETVKDSHYSGSVLPAMNKRLISSSLKLTTRKSLTRRRTIPALSCTSIRRLLRSSVLFCRFPRSSMKKPAKFTICWPKPATRN